MAATVAVAAAAFAIGATGTAQAAHGLATGFYDVNAFQELGSADQAAAFAHAKAARATFARLLVDWSKVAPVRPPDATTARDPGWSGYRWTSVDADVRAAADAGLRPVIAFLYAPRWAEGSHRPRVSRRAPPGSWRPSPTAFRDFSIAIARRYSGTVPDPSRPGSVLPTVRYWQAWNEPNLSNYLSPQWVRRGRRYRAASPGLYRGLVNAFYAGVKSVSRSNVVINAATAPFGDPRPGQLRIGPAAFTRALLCVRGRRLRPFRCAGSPVHFDVLAHHPYPLGSPRRAAVNPNDVVFPDFYKLTRPLRAAVRAGKVAPRRRKQVWATEFSWDTRPPDPHGSRLRLHAQYIQQGLYTLWRQGVSVAIHYLIRDAAKGPGYKYTYQSGLYFRGPSVAADRAKPALEAFRFPFAAFRHRGVAKLWGIAPAPGAVTIEARIRGRWRALTRVRAGGNRVFFKRRRVRKGTLLRASQGSERSLSFRVGPGEKL